MISFSTHLDEADPSYASTLTVMMESYTLSLGKLLVRPA